MGERIDGEEGNMKGKGEKHKEKKDRCFFLFLCVFFVDGTVELEVNKGKA